MKILFINPPFSQYDGVTGHGGKTAPLNLGYLASYIREQKPKIKVSILDCEALNLSYEQIRKFLIKFEPDIVALTVPTPAHEHALLVAKIVKSLNKKIIIVVGGPQPTALPKTILKEKNIDFAVIGEGEITFLKLVNNLEKNIKKFYQIKGLAFKQKRKIIVNPRRKLIKNLNIIPFPAKDILPLNAYYLPPTKRITSGASTNIVTSRGCPFNCTFCMAKTIWKRTVRFRSIENVVDEIEECVKKYNHQDFTFHDEFFTLNRNRVIEFCHELKRRNLNIKWFCQARCGTVDIELLKIMKSSGCEKIGFGFESGDERILKLMEKDNDLTKARKSVKLCKKAGIKVVGAFILGYPGETKKTIKKTINFAKELDPNTAAFFIAAPYPGTELFKLALKKGYLKQPINWKSFAILTDNLLPMTIPGITKKELLKLKRYAYRSFYLRPKYILRKLSEIRNLKDVKSLFLGLKIFKQIA